MEVNLRPPNAVDETPPALRGVVAPPVSVSSMDRGIRTGTQFVGLAPKLTKTSIAAQDRVVPHVQSKLKIDIFPKNKMYNLI